jgi:alpha-tubulin suppressor-like RCC1 family protein
VRCWGYNNVGQLGDGTTTNKRSERVAVTGISDAIQITAANLHTCARLAGGSVRCWGYNAYGQLGDETKVSRSTPVTVAGITDAVDLAAGNNHTCAALSDGTARCWGFNAGGQLGDGTQLERPVPVNVVGMEGAFVVAVATGDNHSCALLANGSV